MADVATAIGQPPPPGTRLPKLKRDTSMYNSEYRWKSVALLCETVMHCLSKARFTMEATLTGFEPTFGISRPCAILTETCANQRVRGRNVNRPLCTIRAELRSSSVRNCPKAVSSLLARTFLPSQTSLEMLPLSAWRGSRRFTRCVILVARCLCSGL